MEAGGDGPSGLADTGQLLALGEGVVDLEYIDPTHQVGPAKGEGIHSGSDDDILIDSSSLRLLPTPVRHIGPAAARTRTPVQWLSTGP